MESEPAESGFDELMRLSRQFKKQEQEREDREQKRAEQKKRVQSVLGGLREITVSTAVEQLKPVATPEIVEKVNSLKSKSDTEELRKLISSLADELENRICVISASNSDMVPIERSMKTLTILMELFFSLR